MREGTRRTYVDECRVAQLGSIKEMMMMMMMNRVETWCIGEHVCVRVHIEQLRSQRKNN